MRRARPTNAPPGRSSVVPAMVRITAADRVPARRFWRAGKDAGRRPTGLSVGPANKVRRLIRLDLFRSRFYFRLRFNVAHRSREQADRAQGVVGEVAARVA